jgi:MFS family permease
MSNTKSPEQEIGGRYAKYVLFVLVLVYVFNFIDRQILSVLAEEIKADLGISDAEIGFLYGTAFAVFYAIFGIPLGRLADVWLRSRLISLGLFFWSVMTAMSGTARSFGSLAVFRFGVGIGEASATPAAFSMLSDYFSPTTRATVLSIYSSGVYIGAGIGTFLGGMIVDGWNGAYPDIAAAPLGIKAWQAAFMVVGLPGILLAIWVGTLREPRRGQSEGVIAATHPHPFRAAFEELLAVLPPLTAINLFRQGGVKTLSWNLAILTMLVAIALMLIEATGNVAQWGALGIGVYAAASWVQNLRIRDYPTYSMIFRCKTMISLCWGAPCIAFVTYGVGFWGVPYMIRMHDLSASEVGTFLGLGAALGGWIGVTLGGVIADLLKRRFAAGRLVVVLVAPILALPFAYGFVTTQNVNTAYVCSFFFSMFSPMWTGPGASTLNDLLLPRMRAIASAFYIMMITFIGLALGPYLIGYVSDLIASSGVESAEALRRAMLYALAMLGVATVILSASFKFLPSDESSRLQRARDAGEVDL